MADDPRSALQLLEQADAAAPNSRSWRLERALGDAHALLRNFGAATSHHRRAVRVALETAAPPRRLLALLQALAVDLRNSHDFDGAQKALHDARSLIAASGAMSRDDASTLLKLESSVHQCRGDAAAALQAFEAALKLQSRPMSADHFADVRHHIDLLEAALAGRFGAPTPPREVAEAMRSSVERLVTSLLKDGPWQSPLQLPPLYVQGLTSLPWWHRPGVDLPASSPLRRIVAVLEQRAADLRAEYAAVASLLTRESECIHDPGRGDWRTYTVTAPWHVRDAAGCSIATPVACGVLQQLRQTSPLAVNRAEFSAVYPGAVLAQHFGTTNAQLKVHLGLIVPLHANGTPCVHLRVGGVAGTWQHDRAIVFDDSFVHEVWSNCDAVRVIFQVVVQHPELLRESEL